MPNIKRPENRPLDVRCLMCGSIAVKLGTANVKFHERVGNEPEILKDGHFSRRMFKQTYYCNNPKCKNFGKTWSVLSGI